MINGVILKQEVIKDGLTNHIYGEMSTNAKIVINFYFFDLLVHHLSRTKYQTEFAIGSTIASVNATANVTSATSIKTVIAIAK